MSTLSILKESYGCSYLKNSGLHFYAKAVQCETLVLLLLHIWPNYILYPYLNVDTYTTHISLSGLTTKIYNKL